jgi:hypothetical protein
MPISECPRDETAYAMAVYECRRLDGELQADGVETLDVRWFEPAELEGLAFPSWVRVALRETRHAETAGQRPA